MFKEKNSNYAIEIGTQPRSIKINFCCSFVTGNFGCQLNWLWNQPRDKLWSPPVSMYLVWARWDRKTGPLRVAPFPRWDAGLHRWRKRSGQNLFICRCHGDQLLQAPTALTSLTTVSSAVSWSTPFLPWVASVELFYYSSRKETKTWKCGLLFPEPVSTELFTVYKCSVDTKKRNRHFRTLFPKILTF